ncbi:BRCA1-A complex subunit RAP80 isoform X3 [Rattus norvegicus]|uniref:BRCA1-A complex subunit RAP80 isoform X3 n=2 Tax=Rattus norvegicus TaxID=10116 RepID=UPI0003D0A5FB|nr:BRCA1-A complex subunit RAP80 isoform X4 [Rattus norvegicus]
MTGCVSETGETRMLVTSEMELGKRMPRRKKKIKEASEGQNLEKKDLETTSSVSIKKKRRLEDLFIVISDSDGEETKEENGLQKMKTKQSNRSKCLAKRKIAQMSEEEQFALALKMSEQEAKEVNNQEEKEEELLRKAIAESLNSRWSSDASAARPRPLSTGPSSHPHQDSTKDSGTTEGIWQLAPPSLCKGSQISQGNEAEEGKEPWDHSENPEEEPLSGSSGSQDQSSRPVFENEKNECGQEEQTSEKHEGLSEDVRAGAREERQGSGASVWHSETKDSQKSPITSLKQRLLLEEEPTTGRGQSSQGLFVEETSEEVLKSSEGDDAVPASQSIAVLTSKRDLVLMPEASTEEVTVCPETQLSSFEPLDLNGEDSVDGREIPTELGMTVSNRQVDNREAGKDSRPPAVSASARVSCPLCNQDFPPTKIEQHAMYCTGLMEPETVLTRRRREAKKKSDGRTAAQPALDISRKEKCYLCKSLVPLGEYQCHVETCLQLANVDRENGTEGMRRPRVCAPVEGKPKQRLRKSKEKGHSQGRLLSLLEQSEHRTTGVERTPKCSEAGAFRMPSPDVEEAGCSRERQSSLSKLNLNESPIKSFVPVSEATNCLVDFKGQFAFRSQTKSGRGRRRKS